MKPLSKSAKLDITVARALVKQYATGEPFSHKEADKFIAGLTFDDEDLDAWSKETTPSGFTRREHARSWVLPSSMEYVGHVEKVKRGLYKVKASTIPHFASTSDEDILQEWDHAWDRRAAIKGAKKTTLMA